MERTQWYEWDAVRCVAGELELVIGVSAGPRIISLRRGDGPNLLYRDHTDFRVGDWRIYGGHRLTVAPEGNGSYLADNEPCLVEQAANRLSVTASPAADNLRRTLIISANEAGFDVCHEIENQGADTWTGAAWAITCVPHAGGVVAPLGSRTIRRWPGGSETPWHIGPRFVHLQPDASRGKIGWYRDKPWVASLQAGGTLVIHAPDAASADRCADNGCNIELFTCADFAELETLGELVTLQPGQKTQHRQVWRVLPGGLRAEQCAEIGSMAKLASPRRARTSHA
jgi:hypothetical protein